MLFSGELAQLLESVSQFKIELRKGARLWPWVAPGITSTVVCADAREIRNTRLHDEPIKRKIAKPVLDNDEWTAFSGAVHV